MDLKPLIKEYLTKNQCMQIATSSNDYPWICTVHFAADNDFNLYWLSARSKQHSLEISKNPKTAATIVHDAKLKQALQIAGNAYEVKDSDIDIVHVLYTAKFGPLSLSPESMKEHNPEGHTYWVFKPTDILLWDEVNFPDSPKQNYVPE